MNPTIVVETLFIYISRSQAQARTFDMIQLITTKVVQIMGLLVI